jgi:hypothetical protein
VGEIDTKSAKVAKKRFFMAKNKVAIINLAYPNFLFLR